MKNIINTIAAKLSAFAGVFKSVAFCNIAAGTHAGHITMSAAIDIDSANLIVKFTEGGIAPANIGDIPAGVCTDCGDAGDILDIALPGCAESSFLCVSDSSVNAGDSLYTANGGKVSVHVSAGAYKVGVALSSAIGGGIVEVDPQNFGSSAYKLAAGGAYVWSTSGKTEILEIPGLSENDIVIASIGKYAGSERNVFAKILPETSSVEFTLDQNGSANNTQINWIIARA
jgi:hypothetical protein